MAAFESNLIGSYIALFGVSDKRFVQMNDKGDVGVLEDANVSPDNLEQWRRWERFLVVDGGGGRVAFYCSLHRRFLRLRDSENSVDGYGGRKDSNCLPNYWDSERFVIVDAGDGKVALHSPRCNRFLRMKGRKVDAKGGPKDVDRLPPASEWGAERFQIVPHPIVRPGDHIALFGVSDKRFVQMNDKGDVGVLEDANVSPDNLEQWRRWERFLVVDGGGGRVAFYCSQHRRFLRLMGTKVDGLGGKISSNARGEWNRGPDDHECFMLVDGGNNHFAFHNEHTNRFLRMKARKVDAKGGSKDVDKLPPASAWDSERFQIVPHHLNSDGLLGVLCDFPPDYEILGSISEGWWGETFKARNKLDRGLYCIKRFKPHALREEGVINRELAALRALPQKYPELQPQHVRQWVIFHCM